MLRFILFPFAMLYNAVTAMRNYLYDRGLKPSVRFDLPVIGIGNLTVGGTGKTPMVEYLIRLLRPAYAVATLSRGYGRTTKGFRIIGNSDDASTAGDEPFQFYRKFGAKVTVGVGEERALAIPLIMHEFSDTGVILLDDAFQHRKVNPSLNILLSDYTRPFYYDYLLPAGRLRESRAGAKRADVVVITKCPRDLSTENMDHIEQLVRRYVQKPVFFTSIRYGDPVPFRKDQGPVRSRIILLTGIANPKPLYTFLLQHYSIVEHLSFPDHHAYSKNDVKVLQERVGYHNDVSIITTEKDRVKLDAPSLLPMASLLPLFYLPIEVEFVKNGKDFDEIVLNHVKNAF